MTRFDVWGSAACENFALHHRWHDLLFAYLCVHACMLAFTVLLAGAEPHACITPPPKQQKIIFLPYNFFDLFTPYIKKLHHVAPPKPRFCMPPCACEKILAPPLVISEVFIRDWILNKKAVDLGRKNNIWEDINRNKASHDHFSIRVMHVYSFYLYFLGGAAQRKVSVYLNKKA